MKSKSLESIHVAVVGAGIAGLTAAIALRLKGARVTVAERAASPESSGAGLQIQPCATRVVHALGMGEELASIGSVPDSLNFIEAHTGRLILQSRPRNSQQTYPHYQAHRADLHNMLLQRATALDAKLLLGVAAVGVNRAEPTAKPKLLLADGRSVSADLLIGADGVRSLVGRSLFGEDDPPFTGQVAYRAMVDASKLSRKVRSKVVMGPKSHFVIYPLRDGDWVNIVAQQEDDRAAARERWRFYRDRGYEMTRHDLAG